jgi:hypothetical protein
MGGASKVAEPVGDYLCKKIAVQVQNDLDEYMANNPEFPVSFLGRVMKMSDGVGTKRKA